MGWHSLIRTVNVCFLSVTSEKPTTYWRLSAALLGLIGNLRTVFCLLITGRLKTNNGQLMRGRKPLAVHCATRLSNKTKIYAWLMLWTCVLLLFGFVRKFEFFLFFSKMPNRLLDQTADGKNVKITGWFTRGTFIENSFPIHNEKSIKIRWLRSCKVDKFMRSSIR